MVWWHAVFWNFISSHLQKYDSLVPQHLPQRRFINIFLDTFENFMLSSHFEWHKALKKGDFNLKWLKVHQITSHRISFVTPVFRLLFRGIDVSLPRQTSGRPMPSSHSGIYGSQAGGYSDTAAVTKSSSYYDSSSCNPSKVPDRPYYYHRFALIFQLFSFTLA